MAQEIERKFLVGEIPSGLAFDSEDEIDQGYLVTGETEVRLRRRGDRHLLTVKRGHGLSRDEVEVPLERESFEALWPLTEGHRVEKTRRTTPLDAGTLEVDTYSGALAGLVTAEIEFAGLRVRGGIRAAGLARARVDRGGALFESAPRARRPASGSALGSAACLHKQSPSCSRTTSSPRCSSWSPRPTASS